MISSDLRKLKEILGFNHLSKLQKYQDFINYVNDGNINIAAFLDLLINNFFNINLFIYFFHIYKMSKVFRSLSLFSW